MIEVICGDALVEMRKFPDKHFDLVLTDPPYGIGYERHIRKPRHEAIKNDDNLDWLPHFLKETQRVLSFSGNAFVFCSWHNVDVFKMEIEKLNLFVRNIIIWEKGGNGMGDLDTTFGSTYEMCIFFNKSPQKLNGRRDPDVFKSPRSGNVFHPTEKPVELMRYLISKVGKEGDTILDPFAGSGTTGVAAKYLKRNCTLIEISPKYCDIIKSRLAQQSLF